MEKKKKKTLYSFRMALKRIIFMIFREKALEHYHFRRYLKDNFFLFCEIDWLQLFLLLRYFELLLYYT